MLYSFFVQRAEHLPFDQSVSDFVDRLSCDECKELPVTDELSSSGNTEKEIQDTIAALKLGKAPVEDGILHEFLKTF